MPRRTRVAASSLVAGCLIAAAVAVAAPSAGAGLAPFDLTPVASGAPVGATAVLANLTMVGGSDAGYVSAGRCSTMSAGRQSSSNGNHSGTAAVANLAVVALDTDGRFCLANQSAVDLIADRQGWFGPIVDGTALAGGLAFTRSTPTRVLDTRVGARLAAGSVTRVAAGAAGASAVLVNLTMVDGVGAGYVTADRCSVLTAGPQVRSNGNHVAGVAVSNLSVVPVDADGSFCVFNQTAVHVAIDVQGTFLPTGANRFALSGPTRVLDTRASVRVAAGSVTRVVTGAAPDAAGAAGASAVLVNLTMVDGVGAGYVTADRCSVLTAGPQVRSNGNHVAGVAVSNLSVVPVDADGSFCVFNQTAVHLAIDLQGMFSPSGDQLLHLTEVGRLLDTRPPVPATPTTSCADAVHIGDSTSVGMISTSLLPSAADRLDAQYRRVGVTFPRIEISGARSIVERLPGQLNAFEVATAIESAGYEGCWVFALGTTDTANVGAGSDVSRRSRIDKMMALVNGDPVMWVTVRSLECCGAWSNSNMQAWNAELVAATSRYPNLRVYDWSTAADPAWFSADRIHYTVDGYRIRARLIADALAATFPV